MPLIEVPVRAATRRHLRRRLPAVLVMWAVCVLGAGWFASATRLGPVVLTFNRQRGIHLTDVALALVVAAVASVATWQLLRVPPVFGEDDNDHALVVELRRLPLVILLWLGAMAVAFWVAFDTKIGPVLMVDNPHNPRRAIHLGDVLVGPALIAVVAWLTVVLLRPGPDTGTSPGDGPPSEPASDPGATSPPA